MKCLFEIANIKKCYRYNMVANVKQEI